MPGMKQMSGGRMFHLASNFSSLVSDGLTHCFVACGGCGYFRVETDGEGKCSVNGG